MAHQTPVPAGGMTLRTKTLATLAVTVGGLITVLFFTARAILMDSLLQMERQEAAEELQHVISSLQEQEQVLQVMVEEWAAREEVYEFASNAEPASIGLTLQNSAVADQHVDLIAIARSDGTILSADVYDPTQQSISLPEELESTLGEGASLLDNSGSRSGLVVLPSAPIMAAAAPIRRNGQEEAVGYLIGGRIVSDPFAHEVADGLGIDLAFYPVDGAGLPEDVSTALESLPAGQNQIVATRGEEVVSG